jgi:hypothetical protein
VQQSCSASDFCDDEHWRAAKCFVWRGNRGEKYFFANISVVKQIFEVKRKRKQYGA